MARSREQVGGETIETWWSYLVLAICFVLNSVVDGIGFSVGPLVVSWLHAFDKDQQVTGWISSIYMAIMFSTGLPATYLLKYFSHRVLVFSGLLILGCGLACSFFATNIFVLYITYGLLGGVGSGMVYTLCISFPAFYFDKHRDFALGMVTAGRGLGIIIFPQIYATLIRLYTWRGAVVFTGTLTLPLAMLLRPPNLRKLPHHRTRRSSGADTGWGFLKELNFWLAGITMNIWNTGALIAIVFLADFAVENGMNESQGSTLVTVLGVSYLITHIVTPCLLGYLHFSRLHFQSLGTFLRGASLILMPFLPTFGYSVLLSSLYGIGFAIQMCTWFPHVIEVCGLGDMQRAAGLMIFSLFFGTLLGPPSAGWLYVMFKSYTLPFVIGGSTVLFSITFLYWIYIRLYCSCHKERRTSAQIINELELSG